MNIVPILHALQRHKIAVTLIILQIAISCAILCNAIYLIKARVERMSRPSGVIENELVLVQSRNLGSAYQGAQKNVSVQRDLGLLRALPGVAAATDVAQIPYGDSSWGTAIALTPDDKAHGFEVSLTAADPGFIDTVGLKLLQGRWFAAEEFQSGNPADDAHSPVSVVTRSLADRLFPEGGALGKSVYLNKSLTRIIGITNDLMRPDGFADAVHSYDSMLLPMKSASGSYLLRTTPAQRDQVLSAAEIALLKADPDRLIRKKETMEEMRHACYGRDRAVVWLLTIVSLCMLAITAFGIGGLVSFWVQQRTRQIGVRRALGATRADILRYFQTENFLIVSGGIALGMLLAFAINQLLMTKYELPRLPWWYLPIGAIVLWLLGQLAVLWPALRAAAIPPATATRSV